MAGKAASDNRIWTKPFVILTFCNFVVSMTMWLLSVEMVEFAHKNFGVSESMAGATLTSYVLFAALARIFLGAKTDEWGARKTLFAVFVINSICPFAYVLCSNIWSLLAVRCVHGVAFGLAGASTASAVVMVLPESRKGEGVGYFTISQAIATAIGPFLAISAVNVSGSFEMVFVSLGVLCTATFFLLFALKLPASANGRPAKKKEAHRLSLDDFVQVSLFPLVGVACLAYVGYSGLAAFMTLYADSLGLSLYASLFFVVYAAAMILTRPRVGKYVDSHGPDGMVRLSLVALAAGFLLMSIDAWVCSRLGLQVAGAVMLLAAALTGFGIGNTQSVIQATIAIKTPQDNLGKANSTFFLGLDLGSGVGPVVLGLAIPVVGYPGMYAVLILVAFAAMVLYGGGSRR